MSSTKDPGSDFSGSKEENKSTDEPNPSLYLSLASPLLSFSFRIKSNGESWYSSMFSSDGVEFEEEEEEEEEDAQTLPLTIV
jgi:hypothetical protein